MKTILFPANDHNTVLITFAVIGLFAFNLKAAQWGSLRANNQSHAAAPAPAPAVHARPVPAPAPAATPHVEHRTIPTPTGRPSGTEVRDGRQHQAFEPSREANRAQEFDRAREAQRVTSERRHLDVEEDRHHAFNWHYFHPGMTVGVLPFGYVPIVAGGITYYYSDGAYLEPAPSGYVAVAPPAGIIVPTLPPGAEAISAGGQVYYYAAGTFYLQTPEGYQVTPAPLGVTVSSLPPDAVPVTLNGRLYYQAGGVSYLPVMQDGVTVYMTVQP